MAALSPTALALFRRMSAADRAHCLRVFAWLQTHDQADNDLLVAALLHDCGKAAAPIAVWQRTLKVLLRHLAPDRWHTLSRPAAPSDWRFPFFVLQNHPLIGAEWAEAAGCAATVVWLIRYHETDPDPSDSRSPLMRCLQDADAAS